MTPTWLGVYVKHLSWSGSLLFPSLILTKPVLGSFPPPPSDSRVFLPYGYGPPFPICTIFYARHPVPSYRDSPNLILYQAKQIDPLQGKELVPLIPFLYRIVKPRSIRSLFTSNKYSINNDPPHLTPSPSLFPLLFRGLRITGLI